METSCELMLSMKLSGLGFRRSTAIACSKSEHRMPSRLQQFCPYHEDQRFEWSAREDLKLNRAALPSWQPSVTHRMDRRRKIKEANRVVVSWLALWYGQLRHVLLIYKEEDVACE